MTREGRFGWLPIGLDILEHVAMMTCLSYVLTVSRTAVWLFLVVGGLGTCLRFWKGGTWEPRYLDWFAVAKYIGALAGLVAINWSRSFPVSPILWHWICTTLLLINILQAIVRDLELGRNHWTNAVSGLLLIVMLPFNVDTTTLDILTQSTKSSGLALYPTSVEWIVLYTTWNAAFSYGEDYSWITRLMLLPPIIISIFLLHRPEAWLAARCFGLMLSMTFRATQVTHLYTPGKSTLTPFPGTVHHKPTPRAVWGAVNLFAAGVMFCLWL